MFCSINKIISINNVQTTNGTCCIFEMRPRESAHYDFIYCLENAKIKATEIYDNLARAHSS